MPPRSSPYQLGDWRYLLMQGNTSQLAKVIGAKCVDSRRSSSEAYRDHGSSGVRGDFDELNPAPDTPLTRLLDRRIMNTPINTICNYQLVKPSARDA